MLRVVREPPNALAQPPPERAKHAEGILSPPGLKTVDCSAKLGVGAFDPPQLGRQRTQKARDDCVFTTTPTKRQSALDFAISGPEFPAGFKRGCAASLSGETSQAPRAL
jgi:hypothetical protein